MKPEVVLAYEFVECIPEELKDARFTYPGSMERQCINAVADADVR